jgi:hypothetical protein
MDYLVPTKSSVGRPRVIVAREDLDEVVAAVLLVLHLERNETQMNIFT